MRWISGEGKAFRSAERLSRLKMELQVVEEQISALRWDADDAHLRALVTENLADRKDDIQAERHVGALERAREGLKVRIAKAEEKHRRLLEKLPPL